MHNIDPLQKKEKNCIKHCCTKATNIRSFEEKPNLDFEHYYETVSFYFVDRCGNLKAHLLVKTPMLIKNTKLTCTSKGFNILTKMNLGS